MSRPQKNQNFRIAAIFISLFFAFALFHMLARAPVQPIKLTFSELLSATALDASSPERVVEITFKENEIIGKRADGSTFVSFGPYDATLRQEFMNKGVKVNFEPAEQNAWWKDLLIQSIPVLLLVFLVFFFMRQLQMGGGKAMSFGKSRAKLMNESQTKVTFKDVAGVDEAKEELEEVVDFLKDPKKFTKLGGKIPKGVLMVGPPGTGKTILARAVAGEAGVPFFTISGSDFVEMFVGVGASRVRDLFEQAKKNAPCIVFIDEIDAVGRHRGAGLGGGHDEREQTLNQLLVEMDGFEANEGVILIAATNRADVLDPALLRPGRFDRRVMVGNPDFKGREAILKVHTRKTPISADVDLRKLAQQTPGFAGADLANLINEAALIAARHNKTVIENVDFAMARDKVMMGPARKSLVLPEKERKTTAFHEAGHAVVAHSLKDADPVHKVSIVPRGRALGVTIFLPEDDQVSMSRNQAIARITYAMGGRAAEELVFDHFTTGAADDLERATSIARHMVCEWGMSKELGPIHFGKDDNDPFVGRQLGKSKPMSDHISEKIDQEIAQILRSCYAEALRVVEERRPALEEIAKTLLVRETIEGVELDTVLKGGTVITPTEWASYQESVTEKENEKKRLRESTTAISSVEDAKHKSPEGPVFNTPSLQGT